jgi:hypothetical protein
MGRRRSTHGPSWTLDPSLNWWSLRNNSWTAFDPTTSRNQLRREKPKYVSCRLPCKESWWHDTYSPQPSTMTSPLAHIKETFHSLFRKAGKVTLQTSSSWTYWSQCQTISWQAVSSPTFAPSPFKKKVKRLCKIGVLRKTNNSEWAAQGFAVKNKQIRFVTDFCMLNRFLCQYPFLLPSIQEIMRTVNGLTFVTYLCDLPSFPSSTSTWDFGWSNLTKKVNDLQQSSSPGASIFTNALRWDYLSAPISIKRKCLLSFWTWKT